MVERAPIVPSRCCRRCQYILDGLPDNRCPECGTPFNPHDPSTYLIVPTRPRRLAYWTDCIGSAFCVLLTLWWLPNERLQHCDVYDFLPSVVAIASAVGLAISGCRRGGSLVRVASSLFLLFSLGLIAIGGCGMINILLR